MQQRRRAVALGNALILAQTFRYGKIQHSLPGDGRGQARSFPRPSAERSAAGSPGQAEALAPAAEGRRPNSHRLEPRLGNIHGIREDHAQAGRGSVAKFSSKAAAAISPAP